jgi:hypothetical protein
VSFFSHKQNKTKKWKRKSKKKTKKWKRKTKKTTFQLNLLSGPPVDFDVFPVCFQRGDLNPKTQK